MLPTLTDKAVEILHQRAQHKEQPFFLYFAMPSPHTPWVPLPEYKGKSGAGLYGDYVAEVDAMIGRVLDTVHELGMDQNTIVIVTSDNGAWWNDRGHRDLSASRQCGLARREGRHLGGRASHSLHRALAGTHPGEHGVR